MKPDPNCKDEKPPRGKPPMGKGKKPPAGGKTPPKGKGGKK